MTARDALAQVKRDIATGHDPDATYRDATTANATVLDEHAPAMVEALEAVLRVLDELSDEGIAQYKATGRVYYDGYSDGTQVAELRALDAIETALEGR